VREIPGTARYDPGMAELTRAGLDAAERSECRLWFSAKVIITLVLYCAGLFIACGLLYRFLIAISAWI